MITLPDNLGPKTSIFGVEAWHSPMALWCLENVLDVLRPSRIVELGTGYGGVTAYLGMWASVNGAHVLSIDAADTVPGELARTLKRLPVCLEHRDIFAADTVEFLRLMIDDDAAGDILLYCDGGNKARELKTFAPFVRPGSVIGCHDWATEVPVDEMEPFMRDLGFEWYVQPAALELLRTLQAFWRRT